MPGQRNPIKPTVSRIIGHFSSTAKRAHQEALFVAERTKAFAEGNMSSDKYIDVMFHFINASGLPRMDLMIGGTADPYFVAKIDNKITFVSTVQPNTLEPKWDEIWMVKNVPENAILTVDFLDKDEGSLNDDFIGSFSAPISTGSKEYTIYSTIRKVVRGTFWMNVITKPSGPLTPRTPRYLFDGPIRYSRHFSPTVGKLTNLNNERLYSTWKIHIRGVPIYFRDEYQHWNTKYKAAQTIFGSGPTSAALRSTIQAAHRMLYARSTRNGFGTLESHEQVMDLLRGGGRGSGIGIVSSNSNGSGTNISSPTSITKPSVSSLFSSRASLQPQSQLQQPHRIKPAVYTYIIASGDDTLRFSETGAAFFVDFASKHALHANCAETVRYSGEFHPRPAGGWANFREDLPDDAVDWELVIDNNSGTYSPDAMLLPDLKALLEYNFPGFKVFALDFKDPALVESREACIAYALQHRGVRQQELQPHATEGEETLLAHAQAHKPVPEKPEEQPPLGVLLEDEFNQYMQSH